MSGSHAFYTLIDSIEQYLVRGSDEYDGCLAFARDEVLDVNDPVGKRHLRGVISGFPKIAAGIQRDAHPQRVPVGR